MESQADHHLDADASMGRVSARAVLTSIRNTQPPSSSRVLPHAFPNSSDSIITTPSASQTSSPNNFRTAPSSPPKVDTIPDSPRVLPLPPARKKHLETSGMSDDRTAAALSSDDGEPLRGNKTPDSYLGDPPSFSSLNISENKDSSPPFSALSLKISMDKNHPLESNTLPDNNDLGHKKVERTRHKVPQYQDYDDVTEIVKPDIKLVSPSPTDETPQDQEINLKGKREDKIPLTKISSSIRSSIKSKLSGDKQVEGGGDGPEKEGIKRKLSGKPSSRLSVEHQLLGVSSSTISNCTDPNENDCITVNEAIQKAGLGRYHALPFVAAAMIIVLKCFLDGVPDNFVSMFQCVFEMDTQLLVLLGFIGSVLGAPIGGALADRFGRRLIIGLGLVALVVSTSVITAAPNEAVLTTFYVIFSMLISAIHPIILVYVMELSPTKTRYITLTLCFVCYSLVSFITPLVIMPLYNHSQDEDFEGGNNWRITWGVLLVPIISCIVLLFFSPESPRYNAAKGKSKEAQTTVFKMLETNLGDKLRLSLSTLELSSNSDPTIAGISLAKLFYRPIQGTTILLTAFLFVCNVQYFASHVLTEEMLTNRCSCGVDITSKGVPWAENQWCDSDTAQCNPDDDKDRTCCYKNMCQSIEDMTEDYSITECPKNSTYPCRSVHYSQYTSGDDDNCKSENVSKYYIFNAVRNVLYVIGFAIGILLAQYTSRKDAFIHLAFYITFINGLLFAVCRFLRGTTFLIFVTSLGFNTVIGAVYSLSWLYMLEYYPTSLRCSGVGYLAGMGQLGNGVGTLISKYTLDYELNVNGRLTIHLFLSNLLTVLSFMLELETKRLPMSDRKRVDCLDHKLSTKAANKAPN